MNNDENTLSALELDILQEIMNISFGKAAAWVRVKVARRENKQPSHILMNTLFSDIFHLLFV